ncbi:type IV secretion protein DotU [Pluralibacter gergoviae]|uniref:type IVB secretion system protein IcmH/DotU n=1 Tax=Pluralibacter gergoviae TaxID=61647 RepID=UPI0004F8D730|nr:type IVB secretion system protein IcmH/DotU [Pluralibacter gergoviae]AIQ99826.1 type IV secretion protein DotU [Pluralibacter gergoviae]
MTSDVLKNEQLSELLFEHASDMNRDSDYWFRMRGQSINPMIDAVTPLLGMVNRTRQLQQYDGAGELYQKVATEIQAIEQELKGLGYEPGVILSFRYILCTFIDEAVMSKEWGCQSSWSENSLLARFHNETWGGEKVFALLEKLEEKPEHYRDILEFIWLCLALGFQGRYRVLPQGQSELRNVIRALHRTLYPEPVNKPGVIHLDLGRQASRYRLRKQLTLKMLCSGVFVLLITVFGFYHYQLSHQTLDVLRQLGELLK